MASSLFRSAPLACGPTSIILSGLVRGVAQGRVPALGQLVPCGADLTPGSARGLVTAFVAARETGPGPAREGGQDGAGCQQGGDEHRGPDPRRARTRGRGRRRTGKLACDRFGHRVDRAQRDEEGHRQGAERGQHDDDGGDGTDDTPTRHEAEQGHDADRRESDDPRRGGATGHLREGLAEDVTGLATRPGPRGEAEQQGCRDEDDQRRALLVEDERPAVSGVGGRFGGGHARWSPSGRRPAAAATARRAAAALLTVSSYSRCGTESATMPAPAWTCAKPSLIRAVRIAIAMSRSPAKSR